MPGDEKLTVRWQAPGDSGGSPVTEYIVQHDGGGPAVDVTGFSHVIEGLTNGTEYRVQVAAVNPAGQGDWAEIEGTPAGPPDAPRFVRAERADGRSSSNGRRRTTTAPRTSPDTRCSGAPTVKRSTSRAASTTVGAASRSHEITGLTNGTAHFVRVLAVNAPGDGEGSKEVPFTPRDQPGTASKCGRGAGRRVGDGHLGRPG